MGIGGHRMSEQLVLFEGISSPDIEIKKPRSKYQQWKYDNKYRKAADDNKRCKNCKNRFITHSGGKLYYKCILLGMSSCYATDIRLSNVCDLFTPKNADCQLCKHLDYNSDGNFVCGLDGEILDHEGIYCSNFEEYVEEECQK